MDRAHLAKAKERGQLFAARDLLRACRTHPLACVDHRAESNTWFVRARVGAL